MERRGDRYREGESETCTIGDLDLKLITRTRLKSTRARMPTSKRLYPVSTELRMSRFTRDEIRRQVPGDTD